MHDVWPTSDVPAQQVREACENHFERGRANAVAPVLVQVPEAESTLNQMAARARALSRPDAAWPAAEIVWTSADGQLS